MQLTPLHTTCHFQKTQKDSLFPVYMNQPGAHRQKVLLHKVCQQMALQCRHDVIEVEGGDGACFLTILASEGL